MYAQPPSPSRSAGAPAARTEVVRAELVLARRSSGPLADPSLDPDPLQSCAGVLAGLQPECGDEGVVCVDLLPASPRQRSRLRRRLTREGRREHRATHEHAAPVVARLLDAASYGGRAASVDLVQRRAADQGAARQARPAAAVRAVGSRSGVIAGRGPPAAVLQSYDGPNLPALLARRGTAGGRSPLTIHNPVEAGTRMSPVASSLTTCRGCAQSWRSICRS